MTLKPDTSPANIARVLRECALHIDNAAIRSAYALAEALDATPVVTWEERVGRIAQALHAADARNASPFSGFGRPFCREWAEVAARAAFPEYAPPTETPDHA